MEYLREIKNLFKEKEEVKNKYKAKIEEIEEEIDLLKDYERKFYEIKRIEPVQ